MQSFAIWNFSWYKYEVRRQRHLILEAMLALKELVIVIEETGFNSSKLKWKRGVESRFEEVEEHRKWVDRNVLGRDVKTFGVEPPLIAWRDVMRSLPARGREGEAVVDGDGQRTIEVQEVDRESWEIASRK